MMTATATILALMLTLLSPSYGTVFRMRDVIDTIAAEGPGPLAHEEAPSEEDGGSG